MTAVSFPRDFGRRSWTVAPRGRPSNVDCPFENKVGRAGERDFAKFFARPFEADLELVPAANQHSNWSAHVFQCRENQRAGHDSGPTGQGFVFHSALVGADRNLPFTALLQEI